MGRARVSPFLRIAGGLTLAGLTVALLASTAGHEGPRPDPGAGGDPSEAAAPGADPPGSDPPGSDPPGADAPGAGPMPQGTADSGAAGQADAPAIDLVRVEPDGTTLVAGTAPKGAVLSVTVDGAAVAQGVAGDDGAFALFLKAGAPDRARVLDLAARLPDGREVAAGAQVVLAPAVPPAAGLPPAMAPRPPAARPGVARGEVRPAVLVSGREGLRLVQPARIGDVARRALGIDAISYDPDGTVVLQGRAAPPPPPVDSVRVYLDDRPAGRVAVAEDGLWRLALDGVPRGDYTLRLDQIDTQGRVTARVETPFRREDPAALDARVAASAAADAPVTAITVQPGFTLWGIAADRYGEGRRYVQLFAANADRIRDPDLIYPGQVLDLPPLAPEPR